MIKFFETNIGKVLLKGVHDHYHGLSIINNYAHLIKDNLDNKELIIKCADHILNGSKKCEFSVDYIYENVKKEILNDK